MVNHVLGDGHGLPNIYELEFDNNQLVRLVMSMFKWHLHMHHNIEDIEACEVMASLLYGIDADTIYFVDMYLNRE